MYYVVICTKGRLPIRDTFLARRIEGPGLSNDFYFQIDPNLALLTLRVEIEQEELRVHEAEIRRFIDQPTTDTLEAIGRVLRPLNLQLAPDHRIHSHLEGVRTQLYKKLELQLTLHREAFPVDIRVIPNRELIALSSKDLETTLKRAAAILGEFYPGHILSHKTESQIVEFWNGQSLLENDWEGLARNILARIFSTRFLVPREILDRDFRLQVEHTGLREYVEGLAGSGSIRDDLDVVYNDSPFYFKTASNPTVPYVDIVDTLSSNDPYESAICIGDYQSIFADSRIGRSPQERDIGEETSLLY